MGKIKQASKEAKTYTLTEDEFNYLKILNYSLALNILKDKVISGFLHHLCRLKYGYKDNINLVFEIDLGNESKELQVKEVSNQEVDESLRQASK